VFHDEIRVGDCGYLACIFHYHSIEYYPLSGRDWSRMQMKNVCSPVAIEFNLSAAEGLLLRRAMMTYFNHPAYGEVDGLERRGIMLLINRLDALIAEVEKEDREFSEAQEGISCCELACYEDPGCSCDGCLTKMETQLRARMERYAGPQHNIPCSRRNCPICRPATIRMQRGK
jgi:hypothetical protein